MCYPLNKHRKLKRKKHVTSKKKGLKIPILSRAVTFYHSFACCSSWSSYLKRLWIYILPLFCTVDIYNAPASYFLHDNSLWWIGLKENDWPKVISLFSCLKKDHVLPLSNPGTLISPIKVALIYLNIILRVFLDDKNKSILFFLMLGLF